MRMPDITTHRIAMNTGFSSRFFHFYQSRKTDNLSVPQSIQGMINGKLFGSCGTLWHGF